MTLTYDDDRFGDRYEIELDTNLEFVSARRHVDGIGSDPIIYDTLASINPYHRHHITELTWKLRRSLSRKL